MVEPGETAPQTPPAGTLQATRVRVEDVDWLTLLPWVRLFGTFRLAMHPPKLLLSLLAVVLLYVGGLALDGIWGPRVVTGEVVQFIERPLGQYERWLEMARRNRDQALELGRPVDQMGIFETLLAREVEAFDALILSATQFDFGLRALAAPRPAQAGGVLGALYLMVLGIPGWLFATHPGFLAVFLAYAFIVVVVIGAAVSRLAGRHAASGQSGTAIAAMRFAGRKLVWFVMAPLTPPAVALVVALLLSLAGLVFFNAPFLDVVGGLIFGLLLLGGLVVAALLVVLAGAVNLMFPAIAVEGTDGFDAVSRSFNYVISRPWRYLFYSAASLVYGALTYLFLGLVIFLALWLTHWAAGWWTFGDLGVERELERYAAIFPPPRLGQLIAPVPWEQLDSSGTVAAALIKVWVMLLIGLLPAYAMSFYFCAHTWIYLLLRESVDGTELNHVHVDEPAGAAA